MIRAVGRWDLTALAINGLIGTAIFGLPASAAQFAGAWSPWACLLCSIIVLFIVLCFAEASSLFMGTGGPYLYAREAFGEVTGLAAGWMMWLARVTAFAANINLLVSYLGFFSPRFDHSLIRAVFMLLFTGALAWINIRGVRQGATLGDILAAGKLIPMFAFVVIGIFAIEWKLLDLASPPSHVNFGQAVLLYMYAFTGFEYAAIPASEAIAPRKHIPIAMLTALFTAAVLYTGIQFVCVGTLPELIHSQTAMASAAAQFVGPLGSKIIALAAVASIAGNLSGMALISPRLTFALADDGLLPSGLSSIHPKHCTPHISILLYAALTIILGLSGTFVGMVRISAVARIVPYVLTCAAVPVLRKKHPNAADRFRLRGGMFIPMLAVALCIWLLAQSAVRDILSACVALAAGFALYGGNLWYKRWRGLSLQKEVKSCDDEDE